MPHPFKRIVIIGATSSIAEHCARLWVDKCNVDLVLAGRNLDKLERIAADLRVRSPSSTISSVAIDFIDPIAIRAAVDQLFSAGPVDCVLIAHGSLPDQVQCQNDLSAAREALEVNGISPVLFAEAFASHLQRQDLGTLAIIGSVAGDRGRKSNYVYGAAKGLVTRYAQGLQHRLAATNVKIVLIKPGPTDTPMTATMKQHGAKLAPVQDVAATIVQAIRKGKSIVYVPGKWLIIMMVIRHLPRFIFNKMDI